MYKPHVVLMDIDMPGERGITGLTFVKEALPETAVIMYTVFENDEKLFKYLSAGANGYLLKKNSPKKLFTSIREVVEGRAPMSPSIAKKVLNSFDQRKIKSNQYQLTPCELEVLQYLAKGYSSKMIGNELGISFDTARSHLKNIYSKLHVNCGKEAIVKAFNEHILR